MNVSRIVAPMLAALLLRTTALAQQPQPATPAATQLSQQQVNEEILEELKAIHQLLERLTQPQPAVPQPTSAKVTNQTGFVLGRADAPLTMIEFTDLQCPFCREYVTVTFDEIKRNWIDTGKLRYVSRDFPLDFHPQALAAARAARCAGEQGRFWEMRMNLMRNANLLSSDYITRTAADLKLDARAFATCTASAKFDRDIQADLLEGVKISISGTPTFVIGRTAATIEGPMLVGALPYVQFDAKLREVLGGSK